MMSSPRSARQPEDGGQAAISPRGIPLGSRHPALITTGLWFLELLAAFCQVMPPFASFLHALHMHRLLIICGLFHKHPFQLHETPHPLPCCSTSVAPPEDAGMLPQRGTVIQPGSHNVKTVVYAPMCIHQLH